MTRARRCRACDLKGGKRRRERDVGAYFDGRISNKSTNFTPRQAARSSSVSRVGFARLFSIRETAVCLILSRPASSSWLHPLSLRSRRTFLASAFAVGESREGKRSSNPDRAMIRTVRREPESVHLMYHIFVAYPTRSGSAGDRSRDPPEVLVVTVVHRLLAR
jgi:hypothetical protein